jgi:hypothetical protein
MIRHQTLLRGWHAPFNAADKPDRQQPRKNSSLLSVACVFCGVRKKYQIIKNIDEMRKSMP